MIIKSSLTVSLLFTCFVCFSWQQPFEEYGYKVKIATLSNGKYSEVFDQDSLVQIGSTILNRKTGKLVYFVSYDTTYSEATLKPDVISRWMSPDPLAEQYYSVSPYTFAANNPVLFVDPNGAEIFIYNWVPGKDGDEGHWEKGHMNAKTEKAMEAFAGTKEGQAFLAQYAKAGQKVGGVEFKEDGKFADQNLNYRESNQDASWKGKTDFVEDNVDKKIDINIDLNAKHLNQENGTERMALTIGHESILHVSPYDDKIVESYKESWKTHKWEGFNQAKLNWSRESGYEGDRDHSGYINNQSGAGKQFNSYTTQLKAVMNPKAVEAAKKQHDSQYTRLKK